MKKAFTLIELVIVIIIIWILFGALGYISWDYVSKLNIQNDQETIESSFSYIQSSTLSQPNFWNYKNLKYIWIKLSTNTQYLEYIGFTWLIENSFIWLDSKNLYISHIWKNFTIYSWNTILSSFSWNGYFIYKPYTLWSVFVAQPHNSNLEIYTWNKIIQFYITNRSNSLKKCFTMNLLSWRLFSVWCK